MTTEPRPDLADGERSQDSRPRHPPTPVCRKLFPPHLHSPHKLGVRSIPAPAPTFAVLVANRSAVMSRTSFCRLRISSGHEVTRRMGRQSYEVDDHAELNSARRDRRAFWHHASN